ncbi:MAG: hypothetical protein QOH07_2418, partial [Mycobacterium sp.]|nr:hypothetical protein [Mycobacterium sp.]
VDRQLGQFGTKASGHFDSICPACVRCAPRRFRKPLGGSGTLDKSKEACQSGRMGLTANELSPYRGPEVQILSPPPPR